MAIAMALFDSLANPAGIAPRRTRVLLVDLDGDVRARRR